MLSRDFFHVCDEEGICKIGHCSRISRQDSEELPIAIPITCFFKKFTLSRVERSFSFFNHTCDKFGENISETMTILFHHYKLAIGSNRNNIYPCRVFQNIILRMNNAIGEFNLIDTSREPRTLDYITAFKYFPLIYFHQKIIL